MSGFDWIGFAQTPEAQEALREAAGAPFAEAERLRVLQRLRSRFGPEQAATLLTQARLRGRAAAKFPHAEIMLFDAAALEQATAWPVALHRAQRLARLAPPGRVLDLGCGIGGDLLALAMVREVVAWEADELRARLARANLAAVKPPHTVSVHHGDWTAALARGELAGAAVFVDPGRRTAHGRVFALEALEPPLSTILGLRERCPALVVKGPPGIDLDRVPAGCSVEFVSHEGVCKEAVLWFGPLAGAARWASVWDEGLWRAIEAEEDPPPVGEIAEGMALFEPDPAVLRAGALTPLCRELNAHLFDPQIGYLVADEMRSTPFATAFRILEVFPFSLKRVNERLKALGVGRVEIKKRGFPQEPESLRPRLRLTPGGRPMVLFLTRRGEAHWALLAERV